MGRSLCGWFRFSREGGEVGLVRGVLGETYMTLMTLLKGEVGCVHCLFFCVSGCERARLDFSSLSDYTCP